MESYTSHKPLEFNETTAVDNELQFAEDPNQVYLPVIMFILGIVSNGFAIASLIHYKLRGVKMRLPKVPESPMMHSRELVNSLTDAQSTNHGERRLTGESRRPRSHRKVIKFGMFHTLVSILAALDFLSTLCTSPLTITLYVKNVHIEKFGGETLCYYSAFAMLFFGFTTMAMVMAMSIERLFSLRFAFLYHEKASSNKALVIAAIIFVFAFILCLMPATGFGAIRPVYPFSWCFADWNADEPIDKGFNYLYVALGSMMLLITFTCNILVIKGLVQMRKRTNSNLSSRRRRRMSRETQMIIQLLVITSIYVLCWLPIMFRILINQLGYTPSPSNDRIAIWLASVNPILDPWVYILCRESVLIEIKRRIKKLPCVKVLQSPTPNQEMSFLTVRYSPRQRVGATPPCARRTIYNGETVLHQHYNGKGILSSTPPSKRVF